ncbi:MAG: hypoxanthine-guanine phosphoribosyltransferase [Gammaproteobacteria bacterium]
MAERARAGQPPEEIGQVLAAADCLHDEAAVSRALDNMAAAITECLGERNPLILTVMIGGMIPATWLLERLTFPFQLDYIHATRYRGGTTGAELHWLAHPAAALAGRSILLVDDILDEGVTLARIRDHCRAEGAAEVLSAVLVEKQHDRNASGMRADFRGLTVPDRYVFGCGMDYRTYYRNLRAIYAVRDS